MLQQQDKMDPFFTSFHLAVQVTASYLFLVFLLQLHCFSCHTVTHEYHAISLRIDQKPKELGQEIFRSFSYIHGSKEEILAVQNLPFTNNLICIFGLLRGVKVHRLAMYFQLFHLTLLQDGQADIRFRGYLCRRIRMWHSRFSIFRSKLFFNIQTDFFAQ